MKKETVIVFPHQLFDIHPFVTKERQVVLVEEPSFFFEPAAGIRFHKKKLLLHRASMRFYLDELRSRGIRVSYVDYRDAVKGRPLPDGIRRRGAKKIFVADLTDDGLERRIHKEARESGLETEVCDTPNFLTSRSWIRKYFEGKTRFAMTPFYIEQRKRLGIMLEGGKPRGGKWSFDPENRRRLPKGVRVPELKIPAVNKYVREAREYVDRLFPDHPGDTEGFFYPVTRKDALSWLRNFLEKRLRYFGDYEDSISREEAFLFHSVLTPALNIGLLTPAQVVRETLNYALENKKIIAINSLEGFIRQIIGWREFMRAVYLLAGEKERSSNFWGHKRGIPESFYRATTGIEPVDRVIRRVNALAYCHHIERLMVLGNFMLLCEIDPDEVYRWFMEMFIDAYDWVMVPNIYGMSQYADGGLITTKPYISSSNYILKMSDFPRGDWCDVWDALYWRFIDRHRDVFAGNPRMRVMTFQLDRMGKQKREGYLREADKFLRNL
jgi:deoxyribodipyrimidine photolyase-related protein